MLALTLVAAVALAQAQSPPTAPRAQSPAQDSSQPGGQQSSQPGVGQQNAAPSGQPGSASQLRQSGQQGQQSGQQRTANFRGEGTSQGGSQAIDGQLAACLILGNQEEIALGKFASQHASSDKVKKFAQQMVDDHTKASKQLQQFAPQGVALELSSGSSGQARNEQSSTNSGDKMGQQMLSIMRDAKQECLNMTEKELGQKRGEEFDHAYVGQQMGGHVQMIASLTAFEKHASPELQRVVSEQKKTAEEHLDHLKHLIDSTKDASHTN